MGEDLGLRHGMALSANIQQYLKLPGRHTLFPGPYQLKPQSSDTALDRLEAKLLRLESARQKRG